MAIITDIKILSILFKRVIVFFHYKRLFLILSCNYIVYFTSSITFLPYCFCFCFFSNYIFVNEIILFFILFFPFLSFCCNFFTYSYPFLISFKQFSSISFFFIHLIVIIFLLFHSLLYYFTF